ARSAAHSTSVSPRSRARVSSEAGAFPEAPPRPVPRRISRLGRALVRLFRGERGTIDVGELAIESAPGAAFGHSDASTTIETGEPEQLRFEESAKHAKTKP